METAVWRFPLHFVPSTTGAFSVFSAVLCPGIADLRQFRPPNTGSAGLRDAEQLFIVRLQKRLRGAGVSPDRSLAAGVERDVFFIGCCPIAFTALARDLLDLRADRRKNAELEPQGIGALVHAFILRNEPTRSPDSARAISGQERESDTESNIQSLSGAWFPIVRQILAIRMKRIILRGGSMKQTCHLGMLTWLILAGAMVLIGGCSRKQVIPATSALSAPPEAETPLVPVPTITITASPPAVNMGQSTTISWTAENTTSVYIDQGIGKVESSGQRTISPSVSATYTAKAEGPGGDATASTRVTVIEGAEVTASPPRTVPDSEFFATRVNHVYFDFDKYDLRADAIVTLDQNAAALKERSGIHLIIEGHCDECGSEKYNLALGDRRAQAARKYLVARGVEVDRIDTISYGEERPFDPGHNEEAWAKNRRAHFVVRDGMSRANTSKATGPSQVPRD